VLAEMGLALLLFVVGLKLDLQVIRKLGAVSLATALGQMTFTGVVGFLLARMVGMTLAMALYLAIAIGLSSTILIVKLLSDKRESDSRYMAEHIARARGHRAVAVALRGRRMSW